MKDLALSKRLHLIVRQLAEKAHEREMRKLLVPLSDAFTQWRSGKKETWALLDEMDRISVPRRRLAERYETTSIAPIMVAYALVAGTLREDEVPKELLDALARPIAFYRQGLADGTVSMEEED